MLSLGLKANLAAPLERLRKMGAKASDLRPLYQAWSRFLRQEAKDRIEAGEGFAPLAESTTKRLKQSRTSAITARGQVRQSYAKRLEVQLRRQVRAEKLEEEVLTDLQTLRAGGRAALHLDVSDRRSKALIRLQKQLKHAQTKQRVGGDKRQSEQHEVLGRMSSTLLALAKRNEAIAESRVPWSGIHNHGGTAGNGARIPARPFLVLTPESIQVLTELTRRYFNGEPLL